MKWIAIVLAGVMSSGCAAAAAGGAAVGGAQMLSKEGKAEAFVGSSVVAAANAAEAALRDLHVANITRSGEGDEVELKGVEGDHEIKVEIEPENGQTQIQVWAYKNKVDYDTSRANEILAAIRSRLK